VKPGCAWLASFLLFASISASSQGLDWSRYKPGRLEEILASSKATQKLEPHEMDIVSGQASYRVMLRFSGLTRPIDPTAKGFIRVWLKLHGLPESHAELFEQEACFREGKETYWLPIQSTLLPSLAAGPNKEAELPVYLVWLGSIGNSQFFFIINGFDDAE
jgi:hypothetical protein